MDSICVGDREAAAAIAGMQEVYGRQPRLPSVGEAIRGVTSGKRWSGECMESQPGRVVVAIDGGWISVRPSEIEWD